MKPDARGGASALPPAAPIAATTPGVTSAAVAIAPAPTASSSASAEPPPADTAAPIEPPTDLTPFYEALRGLEEHRLHRHVRIVWLGDSHGQADFWSGAVRRGLQKRFGDGGPGFIHLGYEPYRHDGVKLHVGGKWRVVPRGPATTIATGDGMFGLGGMLLRAMADQPKAEVTVVGDGAPLTWDLCYRFTAPDDELAVEVGGGSTVVKVTNDAPVGSFQHRTFQSGPGGTLTVTPAHGSPELCGVIVETDPAASPGVVLDNLGINGARFATPLAWNEAAWDAELARRAPDLAVLEYGTNELSDLDVKPEVHVAHMKQLVARVRRVKPDVACMVLAPTDRADREDIEPALVSALARGAREVGCTFWDTFAVMGGKGSIVSWRGETPPRAAKDGVHLAPKGYRDLGTQLLTDMMKGYGR